MYTEKKQNEHVEKVKRKCKVKWREKIECERNCCAKEKWACRVEKWIDKVKNESEARKSNKKLNEKMNKKMERESKVANKVRNVESGRPEIIWVG